MLYAHLRDLLICGISLKAEQFMLFVTYITVTTYQSLFRRPALDGDNWWRGHAAAFLRFVNIAPTALVRGRVRQVMPY